MSPEEPAPLIEKEEDELGLLDSLPWDFNEIEQQEKEIKEFD